jgi:hypothetical protein
MTLRRKYSSPYQDSNSDPSVVQPVSAIPTELSTLHTPSWPSSYLVNYRDNFAFYLYRSYVFQTDLQVFFLVPWGGVRLSPLGTSATVWSIVPAPDDRCEDCCAIGEMRIGRVKQSTRRKPVLVPLCPPQIPHDLTWAGTQAAAVGSRRVTA